MDAVREWERETGNRDQKQRSQASSLLISPGPRLSFARHSSHCPLTKRLEQTNSCSNLDIFITYSLIIIEGELRSITLPF